MAIVLSPREAYIWCATYHDDTQIPEYDEERQDGRGFAELDNARVKTLELWPLLPSPVDQQITRLHRVDVPSGAAPVFFRRRKIELNPNTDTQDISTTHCIGWKSDTEQCYLFVFDDGSTLLSNNIQAI